MGEIIVKKVKGMSLMAKVSLMLVFTMLFSVFMYQGWYKPHSAQAVAMARVQSATGNTGANAATTIAVTMGTAPVNGNTMIAVISTRGISAGRVSSITQTGASWSRVSQAANTNGTTTEIWYAPNVSGATTGVTINLASLRAAAVVMEYSGLLTPTSFDQAANATGNGNAASTGTTATTTSDNELWIGGVGLVSSGYTLGAPTNGFTAVANAASTNGTQGNNARVYAMQDLVAPIGTATTGGTVSAWSQWSGAIATFKPVTNLLMRVGTAVTSNAGGGAVTTYNVTVTAPINGNTLIAVISTRGTAADMVTSITQTGATWQRATQSVRADGTVEIWYAPAVSGASTTVTIDLAATVRTCAVISEYTGELILDKIASSTGTTTTVSTGTTTATSNADEVWIGGLGINESGTTIGTPINAFTSLGTNVTTSGTAGNNTRVYSFEKIVTATGTANTGGTLTATANWEAAIATFYPVRYRVNVATGTNPGDAAVAPGATAKAIDGFTLTATAGAPQVTGVTATVTNPADISSIRLYKDNGVVGTYESGTDTLLATVASPGASVSFTGLTQSLSTTPTNYLIVADIASGATLLDTITAAVSDVTVTGPDAVGAISDSSSTLTINAPTFAFSASNFNQLEGNSGTSTATITVSRSGVTTGTNSVNFATSDGTATTGDGDYVATSGTLTFNPGVTSQTFNITVNGDVKYEADETVNLTLNSPTGGAVLTSPNPATLTIVNDDALPTVSFNMPTSVGVPTPGTAQIPVSLSAASGSSVTVTYNTANLTAVTPTNYTGVTNGTLTFNPGETLKFIPITLVNGNNLTFRVTLSAPTNATLGTVTVNTVTMYIKWPSTVAACNSCHGAVGAFADGVARNNPVNTFLGSHNAHVVGAGYACSVCHVAPGATAYNHRNGTILMASPINGDTGGAYGKGASFPQTNPPAAFQACSNVYCHSQGTSKTTNPGETRTVTMSAPTTALNWGSPGACSSCHGYPPGYATGTAAWGAAKANSHTEHITFPCNACHNRTTTDGTTIASLARHANKFYNISASGLKVGFGIYTARAKFSYAYVATSGGAAPTDGGSTCSVIYCHNGKNAKWGGSTTDTSLAAGIILKCVECHDKKIYRNKGRPDTILADAVSEFGLAWGHKGGANGTKTARAAVTDADCIVCHLEGVYATQKTSPAFHADGNIDLRNPIGVGEVAITDISGGVFKFQRFSTSFAAGSRTPTGHTSNTDIANVVTQKFCLGCHRSGGATNTTARTPVGGTAVMPFGGVPMGATYTVLNGAAAAGGLVDVNTEFNTANSSVHPVRGPNNRDFPTAARLYAPYDNQVAGRVNAGGVKTLSVVINCFDCHNTTGKLTLRTVAAHGNAVSLRGTYYVASPTLCMACHGGSATYATGTSTDHGNGSADTNSGNQVSMTNCGQCHGSAAAKPARPTPAQDYHGNSTLITGAKWPAPGGSVYAFIRNANNYAYHRPKAGPDITTSTQGTCSNGGGCQMGTYTVGGSY